MGSLALSIAAFALVTVSSWSDLWRGGVPNAWLYPAAALGLGINGYLGGWPGLGVAALGMLLGIGLMLLPCMLGELKTTDVKLLAALGALLGPAMVLRIFVYAAFVSGAIALALLPHRSGWRALAPAFQGSWRNTLRLNGGVSPRPAPSFPYVTAIWFGAVIAIVAG